MTSDRKPPDASNSWSRNSGRAQSPALCPRYELEYLHLTVARCPAVPYGSTRVLSPAMAPDAQLDSAEIGSVSWCSFIEDVNRSWLLVLCKTALAHGLSRSRILHLPLLKEVEIRIVTQSRRAPNASA